MTSEFGGRGYRKMLKRSMQVTGEILVNGAAAITAALSELEFSYQTGNGGLLTSIGLYDDNGNVTSHVINDDADCFGGIRVTALHYPKGDATEFVNGRSYQLSVEADFIDRSGGELVEFEETLRYQGTGGPRKANLETLTGPVVRQIVNKRTIRTITQIGRAVGLTAYPVAFISRPIQPNDEHLDRRELIYGQPDWKGLRKTMWPVSWSYQFEF